MVLKLSLQITISCAVPFILAYGRHSLTILRISFLFSICNLCLKHSFVPVQWRVATEVYIPKVKPPNPNNIKDFRPISLLNVEGKLFFSLVSKRLECHIKTNNRLINSSIQKGCMEKIPGCWEHMSMVWNELKSSKSQKGSLAAIWLDIANAYGSVPHQLIFFALRRYGVPEHWVKLIMNYYKGLWSISQSSSAPSSWHHHLRGIFMFAISRSERTYIQRSDSPGWSTTLCNLQRLHLVGYCYF